MKVKIPCKIIININETFKEDKIKRSTVTRYIEIQILPQEVNQNSKIDVELPFFNTLHCKMHQNFWKNFMNDFKN